MIEIEKTYLAKRIPYDLKDHSCYEIYDVYLPTTARHPNLRLRRKDKKSFDITRKTLIDEGNPAKQRETTIKLSPAEFKELASQAGKTLRKLRYIYPHQGNKYEIDIFQDDLLGLVLIEIEFESADTMKAHRAPDFCAQDITHNEPIAGGMLAGKKYTEIAKKLAKYNYKKLSV